MTKRILLTFGTRPEAIKMAPVVNALKANLDLDVKIAVTGQHRQMLDQILQLFAIEPDFDLNVMRPDQTLPTLTSAVLEGLTEVLKAWRPDLMLVHGDTTTTSAATLAAFYERINVAHVEAGLRTGNLMSPWPEEANRKITGALASLHFAPTESARTNLLKENIPDDKIFVTGNTVVDALFSVLEGFRRQPERVSEIDRQFDFLDDERRMVLITGHRRENFGKGFQDLCQAIAALAHSFPDVDFVYPVHLNPNVQKPVNEILSGMPNVHLRAPFSYEPFVRLIDRCSIVLTDSGGIQEEAPSLGKPVLVTRDTTERPEAVEAGTVKLVGTNPDAIISNMTTLLTDHEAYTAISNAHNPYGDGKAAPRIAAAVLSFMTPL